MGTRDPRVDAYIAKSGDFAKPILNHIREVMHAASPKVEETMKWSSPWFEYNGSIMCGMAAFKAHAIFGFWKGALIEGVAPNRNNGGDAMGNFGKLTSVKDLPSRKELTALIKEAMRLNDEGITVPKPRKGPKAEAKVPPELAQALAKNRKANITFQAFTPSKRRDYIDWIDEAKREETKAKRIAQAVEWLAEGKSRNWKYEQG
jgi:uncharacterized protein YdeI (YjbR/CyaY-like superfamily)